MNWRSICFYTNSIFSLVIGLFAILISKSWVYPQIEGSPAMLLFVVGGSSMVLLSTLHATDAKLSFTPKQFITFWIFTLSIMFTFGATPHMFQNSFEQAIIHLVVGVVFQITLFIEIINKAKI